MDKFKENIEKLENVYDLVSFCYDFLREQVANETAFLANYIFQNEEARTFNPNLKLLEAFQGQVMEILKQQDKKGYIFQQTSVYKGYKQDKIEMRGDRAEMSDFPLYLNTVAGGLDRRDQTIGGFSFVVKIYAVPVVEIIG